MHRRAHVVGASESPARLGDLGYAARDATAFPEALTACLGFDPADVRLMTGSAEDPERRPTAGNVFLQQLRLPAGPEVASSVLFIVDGCRTGAANTLGLEQREIAAR